MNEMTITFNGQSYIPIYNEQTGYYEIELQAPQIGGIYEADISFTDFFEEIYTDTLPIQIWAKEPIKLDTNKVFMWIFDYFTFGVKDIVELSDYELNIDEETNANTLINVLKKTTAKARDIIAIKKNNEVVYWGTLDEIQNENGKKLYQYISKYITNIFNQEIVLNPDVSDDEIEDGYYRIKFRKDTSKVVNVAESSLNDGANVEIYEKNSSYSEIWKITKNSGGYYNIVNLNSNKALDVDSGIFETNRNVQQWSINTSDAQKWNFTKLQGKNAYRIKTATANYYLTVDSGNIENGTNIKISVLNILACSAQQIFILEKVNDILIKEIGIEDYIAKTIEENFISSNDEFINKEYLQLEVKTHTPLQTSVTNVENGIYNLHTWMTNCTQNYNIVYDFYIDEDKLIMTIENKTYNKEIIDTKAQAISNYTEVFETDVVSKVTVLYNKVNGQTQSGFFTLYLLNDRTTTTDMTDPDRADGKSRIVYTENYEDAEQEALNVMKSNSYNHNITFNLLDRYIKVGTPIAIKTKESIIYDTYISAIKITQNKFYEYICGNIRIKFIDKLLKGRKE